MLVVKPYNRDHAVMYGKKWAYKRNDLFFNFTGLGGDCTNFVSQCIFAGSCIMNFSATNGWYYKNPDDRAPSWAGVSFFYEFVTQNIGVGPYAHETNPDGLQVGDVIQLGRNDGVFYHTLLVTGYQGGTYLVAAHTDDAFNRRLDTYQYSYIRFLHIEGVRIEIEEQDQCFEEVLRGKEIEEMEEIEEIEDIEDIEDIEEAPSLDENIVDIS